MISAHLPAPVHPRGARSALARSVTPLAPSVPTHRRLGPADAVLEGDLLDPVMADSASAQASASEPLDGQLHGNALAIELYRAVQSGARPSVGLLLSRHA